MNTSNDFLKSVKPSAGRVNGLEICAPPACLFLSFCKSFDITGIWSVLTWSCGNHGLVRPVEIATQTATKSSGSLKNN